MLETSWVEHGLLLIGRLVVEATEGSLLSIENHLLSVGLLHFLILHVVHIHRDIHLEVVVPRTEQGCVTWSLVDRRE